MPGRYSLTKSKEDIESRYCVKFKDEFKPRYNISPTQKVPIIIKDPDKKLVFAKWGFERDFSKSVLINSRSEGIDSNKVFKKAFNKRRCLIPADSYYEWKEEDRKKLPFRIMLEDDEIFSIAGVWEQREEEYFFAAITIEPNEMVSKIHHRMPVILKKENEEKWLDNADTNLLKIFPSELMKSYRISEKINSSRVEGKDLINPVDIQKKLFEF